VIQSAAIEDPARDEAMGAKNACVFVLDMGEPVRILDLAMPLRPRLHGFEPRLVTPPGEEVEWTRPWGVRAGATPMDVVISGARPGKRFTRSWPTTENS
jgi:FlaA1/EpsC-like NDP-sugar epimerase